MVPAVTHRGHALQRESLIRNTAFQLVDGVIFVLLSSGATISDSQQVPLNLVSVEQSVEFHCLHSARTRWWKGGAGSDGTECRSARDGTVCGSARGAVRRSTCDGTR